MHTYILMIRIQATKFLLNVARPELYPRDLLSFQTHSSSFFVMTAIHLDMYISMPNPFISTSWNYRRWVWWSKSDTSLLQLQINFVLSHSVLNTVLNKLLKLIEAISFNSLSNRCPCIIKRFGSYPLSYSEIVKHYVCILSCALGTSPTYTYPSSLRCIRCEPQVTWSYVASCELEEVPVINECV